MSKRSIKLSIGSQNRHPAVALPEPAWPYNYGTGLLNKFALCNCSNESTMTTTFIFTAIAVVCNHKGVTGIAISGWVQKVTAGGAFAPSVYGLLRNFL